MKTSMKKPYIAGQNSIEIVSSPEIVDALKGITSLLSAINHIVSAPRAIQVNPRIDIPVPPKIKADRFANLNENRARKLPVNRATWEKLPMHVLRAVSRRMFDDCRGYGSISHIGTKIEIVEMFIRRDVTPSTVRNLYVSMKKGA